MFRDSLVTGGALSPTPGFICRYVLSQVCLKVTYSYTQGQTMKQSGDDGPHLQSQCLGWRQDN